VQRQISRFFHVCCRCFSETLLCSQFRLTFTSVSRNPNVLSPPGVNTPFMVLCRAHTHGFFVLGNSFSRRLPDLQVRVESAYPSSATACCDRKSRAACAQSFALWQQATIEITCHDHSSRTLLLRSIVDIVSITRDYTPRSLYYCLFAPRIRMVLFFTHIPFTVNHTINAIPPERLQQFQAS